MGKKKTTQTNQIGWSAPPATTATNNLQAMVDKGVDYQTPIRNQYARAEQNYNRSFNNPLGSHTTADVKDKSMRANHQEMQQNLGLDLSNAAQENAQGQFSRQATVAGLTAPQMYNSGSTTSQPTNWLGLGSSILTGGLL